MVVVLQDGIMKMKEEMVRYFDSMDRDREENMQNLGYDMNLFKGVDENYEINNCRARRNLI